MQTIAIYEDNTAQNPPLINTRPIMAFGEVRSESQHLLFAHQRLTTHESA